MQPHPDRQPAARMTAMPLLFARYVAGQIEDPFWHRFMQILDANETPAEERLALATFFHDAFAELEHQDVKIPRSEEVREILTAVWSQAA